MKEKAFRRILKPAALLIAAVSVLGGAVLANGAPAAPGQEEKSGLSSNRVPALIPIDPQMVQDQQDMTWNDYHPIPGKNWADAKLDPPRKMRISLIAIDFPDQPFVITLPRKSDLFGNPQIEPVPREKVPQFYADFYNTPGPINHGQTINGYWKEQ